MKENRTPGTMTEKIFSLKAGRNVRQGEYLLLDVDVALGNDITAPVAINEFERFGGRQVCDPDRIVLVADHFTPNKDIQSAQQVKLVRDFARAQGIEKFYDVGKMGIEHVLLPEQGLVKSGDLIVGADSHTCTYGALGAFSTGVGSTDLAGVFFTGKAWFKVPEAIRVELSGSFRTGVSGKDLILYLISLIGVDGANYQAIEFCGPGTISVSMDSRFTVSNMAIEAGGKTGIFPVDELTQEYEVERGLSVERMGPDEGAVYSRTIEIDLGSLEPMVARPFLPSNGAGISVVEREGIAIHQVVIGSCTNGRIEDLRAAAAIMHGKKIADGVRCIILPGSQEVYLQAMREGLVETFVESGCAVSTPTCGPCLGGHMGILAEEEVAISTTNRNFVGRMGHVSSALYLASPVVAASSALTGRISGPSETDLEKLTVHTI
ncbi:MAG: 3-isopropylmalate dehydratase large subunit [Spirochaetota bacterium]|nr:3-isopropylmalate dehydratase large subunit [Spirochaetota bacterium]